MNNFDLTAFDRQELTQTVQKKLNYFYSNTDSFNVSPQLDIEKIKESVRKFDFRQPLAYEEAINHIIEGMSNYSVHTTHPKYFGLFNPRPSFPSIMGDLITAVFNPQLAAWSHSPFAVEIEEYLISEFGKKFGYDEKTVSLRACITNYNSSVKDIHELINAVNKERSSLKAKM